MAIKIQKWSEILKFETLRTESYKLGLEAMYE